MKHPYSKSFWEALYSFPQTVKRSTTANKAFILDSEPPHPLSLSEFTASWTLGSGLLQFPKHNRNCGVLKCYSYLLYKTTLV